MTFVVGLTGGIGSGKTTVAHLFVQRGATLVDTDAIAHQLTGPQGAAMAAIAAAFGTGILRADGGLDRAAMRQRVFSDGAAKALLETILHPMIRLESIARCAAARDAPYVLLAVPLLVEAGGYREHFDRILVVDCSEEVQLARVMARNGLSSATVRTIMATQATRAERRDVADDLLLNDGVPEALVPQVEALHQRYCKLAAVQARASDG